MSNTTKLTLLWQRWMGPLTTIVKSRNAQLQFPSIQEKPNSRNARAPNSRIFHFSHPICILNAPQKAASRMKKMHVLIDGYFHFEETGGHPCLTHAGANVTLLHPEELEDERLRLKLVDALHFDVESPEGGKRKGFHPFFHMQRGTSHSDEVIKSVLAEAEGWDVNKILVDQSSKDVIGHPYLRIPTPQLDVFAVLTMVVADCFCNPGFAPSSAQSEESNPETLFSRLLILLTEANNVMREGTTSRELCERVQAGQFISAAHWYPEWSSTLQPI